MIDMTILMKFETIQFKNVEITKHSLREYFCERTQNSD